MTAAVPAAEARALPSATPRTVVPLAPPSPTVAAQPDRSAAPRATDPARIPVRDAAVDAVRGAAPAPHARADRPPSSPSPAAAPSGDLPRADAADGSAVVRNAAGRAIDPAVADRLRADPLVRQVTDTLDAPVQRIVPRRGRPAPTQDGEE